MASSCRSVWDELLYYVLFMLPPSSPLLLSLLEDAMLTKEVLECLSLEAIELSPSVRCSLGLVNPVTL